MSNSRIEPISMYAVPRFAHLLDTKEKKQKLQHSSHAPLIDHSTQSKGQTRPIPLCINQPQRYVHIMNQLPHINPPVSPAKQLPVKSETQQRIAQSNPNTILMRPSSLKSGCLLPLAALTGGLEHSLGSNGFTKRLFIINL